MMMKTAMEMLDRMESLVRELAAVEEATLYGLVGDPKIEKQREAAKRRLHEARAIVDELPPVVDADVLTARKLASSGVRYGMCESQNGGRHFADFLDGSCDGGDIIGNILAAIRRAREEGVKS